MAPRQPYVNAGMNPATLKSAAKPKATPKPLVKAKPQPKAAPTKAKPAVKTGMAGLYGGVGPQAYVNNLYAPQEQALANQQAARTAAYKAMLGQFLDSLKGVSTELAPYTNSASQQTSDASNAASGLAAANPNPTTLNDLAAIGAPQAQQAQVGGQNNTVFGGGASLLNYLGGKVPSDQFSADAAARASYLNYLPIAAEALGTQGFNSLSNMASKENLALASDKASALQKAQSDLGSYVLAKQKLAGQQAAATAKATNPNVSLSRALGYLVDSSGNPVLRGGKLAVLPGFTTNANGQVVKGQKVSGGGGKGGSARYSISSSLSKQTGFWTDTHGNIVIGADGKPIKWKNSVKAPAKPSAAQTARWNGSLQKGYQSMPAGTSYADYLSEAVAQNVPLGAAIAFANKHWPITQRATAQQIAQIAGATPQDVAASGAPAAQKAYQQMTQSGPPQQYAISQLARYGWNNAREAQALDTLWNNESGWNPNAVNPSSGAYGIPQALGHGHVYNLGDYKAQINWGLNYIKRRYGSPSAALAAWLSRSPHWY